MCKLYTTRPPATSSPPGGHPPPLHPLLHRALLSLPASPAGRVALLTHAPRLAEALAACLGSPLARGTPEQHVASYALADMARVLPTCVAAHPVSMQVGKGVEVAGRDGRGLKGRSYEDAHHALAAGAQQLSIKAPLDLGP